MCDFVEIWKSNLLTLLLELFKVKIMLVQKYCSISPYKCSMFLLFKTIWQWFSKIQQNQGKTLGTWKMKFESVVISSSTISSLINYFFLFFWNIFYKEKSTNVNALDLNIETFFTYFSFIASTFIIKILPSITVIFIARTFP